MGRGTKKMEVSSGIKARQKRELERDIEEARERYREQRQVSLMVQNTTQPNNSSGEEKME